jgi:hypothetical protein
VPTGSNAWQIEVRVTAPGKALDDRSTKFPIEGITTRFHYPSSFLLFDDPEPGTYVVEIRKDAIDVIGRGTVIVD